MVRGNKCRREKLVPISDKSARVGLGITSAIALNNGDLIENLCFLRRLKKGFVEKEDCIRKKGKSEGKT